MSNCTSVMEISQKNLIPRVPPFKVTGTDKDRSATYYFQLVIRSNHGPLGLSCPISKTKSDIC